MTTLHLEVNDAGGWRRVMSFSDGHLEVVKEHADYLFAFQDNARLRARIIAPGTTAPMMVWHGGKGWQEWRT